MIRRGRDFGYLEGPSLTAFIKRRTDLRSGISGLQNPTAAELVEWFPKGPCRHMAYTWALKGLPYLDFGAHACTVAILGPFEVVTRNCVKLEDPRFQAVKGHAQG